MLRVDLTGEKISDKERLKKIITTWASLKTQMEAHHITREILLNDEFSQR